jgi:pimeloyl-ACP methyl ester carboxylesterase
LCGVAAWLAACALGAWTPFGVALTGAALGLATCRRVRTPVFRHGVEAFTFITAGLVSAPPLGVLTLAAGGLGVASFGWAADTALARAGRLFRQMVALGPLLAGLALFLLKPQRAGSLVQLIQFQGSRFWAMAVSPSRKGQPVTLPTGSAAWLDRPSRGGKPWGVVFFHGAHPHGAHQPAAEALRRAFLTAGLTVLAVDHPGFGDSPAPIGADAGVQAWDPLPAAKAALDVLQKQPGLSQFLAAGHSMGCSDALRLLCARPRLDAAVLFGAGFRNLDEHPKYWRKRFHRDRRLVRWLDPGLVDDIQDRYYDNRNLLRCLTARDHPPILFVRFDREHPNITATRDPLYAGIPEPKASWQFVGSNHYLNSMKIGRYVFGDAVLARRLARKMSDEFVK